MVQRRGHDLIIIYYSEQVLYHLVDYKKAKFYLNEYIKGITWSLLLHNFRDIAFIGKVYILEKFNYFVTLFNKYKLGYPRFVGCEK